ncbi:hypothetical protein, partial [Salmonella enterica]|uniref:hypothetical protein n=1 Tax=Salmonella enterica TaxID=28901 RepID=UPI003523479C
MVVNEDYSLARMLAREQAVVNNGAELTAQQRQEIKDLHDKLAAAQQRIAVFETQEAKRLADTAFEQAKADLKRARATAAKTGEKPVSFLQRQAELAKARIKERKAQGRLQANLD